MKGNVTIFASIVMMVLVAAGVGAGTMAYFSSTENAAITFTSGTPDLEISIDNGASWHNGVTTSFPVWSPGDSYEIYVYTRNVGNVGLDSLFVTGADLTGSLALAQNIQITDVAYTDSPSVGSGFMDSNGHYWVHPGSPGAPYYGTIFGNDAAPLTLDELSNYGYPANYAAASMHFGWGSRIGGTGPHAVDYLLPNSGSIQGFYIKFTFDPLAGNELQGTTCGFNLVLRGTDELWTAVWP